MQTSPALFKERVMDTLIFSSNKTISRAVAKRLKQGGEVDGCGRSNSIKPLESVPKYHILEPT